jgi:hypothetical protein
VYEHVLTNVPMISFQRPSAAEIQHTSVYFDFHVPAGIQVSTLSYGSSFTTEPVTVAPTTGYLATVLAAHDRFSCADVCCESLADLHPVADMRFAAPAVLDGSQVAWLSAPRLEQELSESVPAAVAAAATCLDATHGLGIPPAYLSIEEMKAHVGWAGDGVDSLPPEPPWWDLLAADLVNAPWHMQVAWVPDPGTGAGRESAFDALLEALRQGGTAILWSTCQAACVTSCVKFEDEGRRYFALTVVHDLQQGTNGGVLEELVVYDPVTANTYGGWSFDDRWLEGYVTIRRSP